jgi:hypothetical protein
MVGVAGQLPSVHHTRGTTHAPATPLPPLYPTGHSGTHLFLAPAFGADARASLKGP